MVNISLFSQNPYLAEVKPKDPEKEHAIRRATLRLVTAQGLAAVKMSQVANLAGLATGTLYIYHASKEQLLLHTYRVLRKQALLPMQAGQGRQLFLPAFRDAWQAWLRHRIEQADAFNFVQQFRQSPYFKLLPADELAEMEAPFRDIMERGKAEMLIRDLDSGLLVQVVNGILNELAQHYGQSGEMPDQLTQKNLFQMTWDAIKY